MQAHCLHIKVAELNTPENGISGIPSAVFLMRWEIKRRQNGETFTQIVAVGRFLIFQKILMTAKAMCLRIKVAQLNSLSVGKEITGIPSRPTRIFCPP